MCMTFFNTAIYQSKWKAFSFRWHTQPTLWLLKSKNWKSTNLTPKLTKKMNWSIINLVSHNLRITREHFQSNASRLAPGQMVGFILSKKRIKCVLSIANGVTPSSMGPSGVLTQRESKDSINMPPITEEWVAQNFTTVQTGWSCLFKYALFFNKSHC